MDNTNPLISNIKHPRYEINFIEDHLTVVTTETIFELLRDIKDPEHPYTLEQLNVINYDGISIKQLTESDLCLIKSNLPINIISVEFTPTVPHCSLVGIIGLSILYKLKKHISNFQIELKVAEHSHSQEDVYNKQFTDNERILAAFENETIVEIIESCIE